MNGALIGISTGLIVILSLALVKQLDKFIIYSLILTGIGFLYVGYTWMDVTALSINIVQAIFFLFLSYFGIKKNMSIMVAGFFLHGLWDLVYDVFADACLLPPQYDMFCFTIDILMGMYLWFMLNQQNKKNTRIITEQSS